MIRPRPKPGLGRARAGAIGLTAALLVGAQTALAGIPVPAFASGREVIRRLDALILERFAAPAPSESGPTEESEPIEGRVEETVETVSFEEEVGEAMAELERRFGLDTEIAPPTAEREGDEAEPGTPGITDAAVEDRFESLFGAGGDVIAGRTARGARGGARGAGGGGLAVGIDERVVAADDSTEPSAGVGAEPGVAVAAGGQREEVEPETVALRDFESEGFDGSEADRLAQWLRDHPSTLPVGVRQHMNFEPSFLTASVPVRSGGRSFELYLMFNEALRELHIVLVEGDRSVYLIDRDFQEQSRSLREGTVRRQGGEIVAVDSRTAAASSERAQEFYDVFLGWWSATGGGDGGR